jgi:hypothetical protein
MNAQPSQSAPASYEQAWRSASDGEARYLSAVAGGSDARQLRMLAGDARDLWSEVVVVCGGFEAVARDKIVSPPRGNRLQLLHQAWSEFSDWRGRSDDASARCQLFAALTGAHLDPLPAARGTVRLDAVQR